VSVWKVVKWVAYRLPILATAVFAIIFLTKDELSKSQSPTLLLIVNTFKDHLALVLAGLLIFLFYALPCGASLITSKDLISGGATSRYSHPFLRTISALHCMTFSSRYSRQLGNHVFKDLRF
jgi:hypothetical protein